MHRSEQQIAEETAYGEVSDVLLCIEHALTRARKAANATGGDTAEACRKAATELDVTRRALQQAVYWPS